MTSFFAQFLRNQSGATAIEYAMIAVGIGVAIVATVSLIGSSLNEGYAQVAEGFN